MPIDRRDGRIFLILVLAIIFTILGLLKVPYCLLVSYILISLYSFLLARTSVLTSEIFLDYSLAIMFMIDAAGEVFKIYHNTEQVTMHSLIQVIYMGSRWIAIISFISLIIGWIRPNRPPKNPKEQ